MFPEAAGRTATAGDPQLNRQTGNAESYPSVI